MKRVQKEDVFVLFLLFLCRNVSNLGDRFSGKRKPAPVTEQVFYLFQKNRCCVRL